MLIKKPPTDAPLTFRPPGPFEPGPSSFSMPLSPKAIPRPPEGKMTRKKQVRLRKKFNRLRRLAKIGKVRLVIRSYMHATWTMREETR